MEVGLDLVVTYEDGVLFNKKVLDIDEKQFLANLTSAYLDAMSLSLGVAYTSKETINLLVQKAFREAKTVAVECKVVTDETVKDMLTQAVMETKQLKANAGIEADESLPAKSQKEMREIAEVEGLAKELLKKGTLRS
jgi:bacterioferritin-associated ferredoxin